MTDDSVPKMEDEYLDTDQLAAYLHVSPQTLRQWRWLGQGPAGFKVGRRVLYPRSAVVRWLAEQAAAQGA
jgi:predicted DNA-binding transcriptional regulator AlpA